MREIARAREILHAREGVTSPSCLAVNNTTAKAHSGPDPEDDSERAPESRRSTWDKPGRDELGKSSLKV